MSGLNFSNDFDGRKPSLQKPGVFAASLSSVNITNIQDKDGNIKFQDVLQFEWFISSEGISFTHTEFPIKDTVPEQKIKDYDDVQQAKISGLYRRLGHILKHYVPEELLMHKPEVALNLNWRGFLDLYNTAIEKANALSETEVPVKYLKILGSVYNGKARVGLPNYLGFIGDTDASVAFGPKEIQSNAEWAQFQANSAAAEANPMAMDLPSSPDDASLNFEAGKAPF